MEEETGKGEGGGSREREREEIAVFAHHTDAVSPAFAAPSHRNGRTSITALKTLTFCSHASVT